ncbi:tetratricopeptide repeat protein [Bacteriovoracaceae bacterium]|nr:tetratricopeptide repeat protein [Bacteriovoracaceae bacterium]
MRLKSKQIIGHMLICLFVFMNISMAVANQNFHLSNSDYSKQSLKYDIDELIKYSPEKLFILGNQFFDQGNYNVAIIHYKALLKGSGPISSVYHNLGNSYFRLGKWGNAIYSFRRSVQLDSNNSNAKFNLAYARKKSIDNIPKVFQSIVDRVIVQIPLNQRQTLWITVISSLFFWLLLAIKSKKMTEWLYWCRLTTIFLITVFGMSHISQIVIQKKIGVITAEKASVKSSIGRDGISLFTLHKGTEFEILESKNNEWFKIFLMDGKKGWINQESIVTSLNEL